MEFKNKYLLALVPLAIVGFLVYFFSNIVTYVLLGWVLSMIGAPLVVFLRKYVSKNLSAGIVLGLFIFLFLILIYVFIPPLSTQARKLADIDYTELINNLEEPINDWENWLANRGFIQKVEDLPPKNLQTENDAYIHSKLIRLDSLFQKEKVVDSLALPTQPIALLIQIDGSGLQQEKNDAEETVNETFFDRVKSNLYGFLNPSLIPQLFRSVVGTLSSFLIGFMSVLFIAFFFLREQGLFNNMVAGVVPDQYETQTIQAINESSALLIRYFIGILTQMFIITLFVSIVLSLIGVKNALLIGFFAALMNIIPYVGPILGATFAIIITISSNLGIPFYGVLLPLLIKVLIVFAIMQLIDNFILQPNIFSKSVKAHPLEIFLVVLIGANLGGIGGMVLAIPAYTVIRIIAKIFLSEFKVVQRLTRGL